MPIDDFTERVNRREAEFVADCPALPPDRTPPALVALTTAAEGGALWLGIAGILALRPGATRRAGAVGAVAVVLASTTSHVLARLVDRRRPAAGHLPAHRSLPRQPTSPSMPSSHAATAAAFTAAVYRHHRLAGLCSVPLALAVAYSRVRTRAHWPSDVVVGYLLGAAIGWLVRIRSVERAAS